MVDTKTKMKSSKKMNIYKYVYKLNFNNAMASSC
jgi:hypothetical protein